MIPDDKNLHIILSELQVFARDIGLDYDNIRREAESGNPRRARTFYQIFCRHHARSVWFYDGKLWCVSPSTDPDRCDIEIRERVEQSPLTAGVHGNDAHKTLFWVSVVTFGLATSGTATFFLALVFIAAFLLHDRLRSLAWRVQMHFGK